MSPILVLCIFVFVSAAAMLASRYAYETQRKQDAKNKSTEILIEQADLCKELATFLSQLSENRSLMHDLLTAAIKKYQKCLAINPKATDITESLASTQEVLRTISTQNTINLHPIIVNEKNIGLARVRLKHTERVLRKMLEIGELGSESFAEYHNELIWLYLKIEVEALVHLGNLYQNRGDTVQSRAFYQRAINALKKSPLQDIRRQQKIEEISQTQAEPSATHTV